MDNYTQKIYEDLCDKLRLVVCHIGETLAYGSEVHDEELEYVRLIKKKMRMIKTCLGVCKENQGEVGRAETLWDRSLHWRARPKHPEIQEIKALRVI